jgi:hypothetical protein
MPDPRPRERGGLSACSTWLHGLGCFQQPNPRTQGTEKVPCTPRARYFDRSWAGSIALTMARMTTPDGHATK